MQRGKGFAIPALDGVRGLAIVLVVWSHAGPRLAAYGVGMPRILRWLTGFSYAGVDLFFVLSGFLLFLPYARALLGEGTWPSTRDFYARRARRILPAYYAVLCVIFALIAVRGRGEVMPGCSMTAGAALQSLTLVYDLTPNAYCTLFFMDGPLWSLTVEWQFYLVLPALALGLMRMSRRGDRIRRVFYGLGMVIVLGFVVQLAATVAHYALAPNRLGVSAPWTLPYALLFGINGKYLDVFALGMMAAVIYVAGKRHGNGSTKQTRVLARCAGVAGAIVLAACVVWASRAGKLPGSGTGMTPASIIFPRDPAQWPWAVWGDWTICLGFTCLLLGVLFLPGPGRLLSYAPMRALGRVSYSVYLWHYLILMPLPHTFTWRSVPAPLVGWVDQAALWVVILSWGTISYLVIERPFLRATRPSVGAARPAPQVACTR